MPTQAAADVAALKVKVEDAKKKARAFGAATRSPHDLMRYVLCDLLPDEDVNGPLVENLLDAPPADETADARWERLSPRWLTLESAKRPFRVHSHLCLTEQCKPNLFRPDKG